MKVGDLVRWRTWDGKERLSLIVGLEYARPDNQKIYWAYTDCGATLASVATLVPGADIVEVFSASR